MEFVKEQVDELNALIKVKVKPQDYSEKVDKAIKDLQRKASIPGFRPGKVPAGMIKKMYGKSVLVEELNKLLFDKLNDYVKELNVEVLGNPLPKRDNEDDIDWDNQTEFDFTYELGLAPQFKVDASSLGKFDFFTVKIDQALVDKNVDDIARRYGKLAHPETSEADDMLFGEFAEVDAAGSPVPNGLVKGTTVYIQGLKNEALRKHFIGLTKGGHVILKPEDLKADAHEAALMIGVEKEKIDSLANAVKFSVNNITRVEPAELNAEFFEKVYGAEVKTLDDFKAKVKEELTQMFDTDSDRRFKNDVAKFLVEKLGLKLPDEFLKRWLVAANEKPVTMEQVNAEYPQYADGLKWQLIENRIIKDNNITVSVDEVKDHVADLIKKQYFRYNQKHMEEAELNATISRVLSDQEEVRKLYERLYDQKIVGFLKAGASLNFKEQSYDEFYGLDQKH